MVNDLFLPEWQVKCIRKLLKLNYVKLRLIIFNNNSKSKDLSILKKIRMNKKFLLFELYQKIFISKSKAFKKINCVKLFQNIKTLKCKTTKKRLYSQYFSNEDVKEIRSYKLDFILRFGFGIIIGEILNSAKYGVWSYHHDDEKKYRGSPSLFWEIFYNDPISAAVLQRLTERLDGGIILKKGYFKTISYSLKKNREIIYFESSCWPAKVCVDIKNGNIEYLNAKPSKTNAPIYKRPKNGQTLFFLFKLAKNLIKLIFRSLFIHTIWNIGLIEEPIQSFLNKNFKPNIIWLTEPKKDRFFADPFGLIVNNHRYILCEEFSYKNDKGVISFFKNTKNRFTGPNKIISKHFHLSYPFIFKYNNDIYCIPESFEANKVNYIKL